MKGHLPAIATISLGWHSSHTLEWKLRSAALNGFAGVEMVYSDLEKFASSHSLSMRDAAPAAKDLCDNLGLTIVSLAAFENFEGASTPILTRLVIAKEWIALARALGTSVIQIPSTYDPDASGDWDTIVRDLRLLADLGASGGPCISFAYEALAWGLHIALWEDSLRVVNLVDRPNFGLCLDSYHVLARLWADPRSKSGKAPGGDAALKMSLERFMKDCPVDKIIYVQLSDAERLDPPLLPGHEVYIDSKDPTQLWCLFGRLFPFETEKGGYLPVIDVCRIWLVDKGWKGWVSMEVFHREMHEEATSPDVLAGRGMQSWCKISKALGLPLTAGAPKL
ncbi:xylose isomerase-like protein [Coleophoma crateriformis]|uniref:Xylose isomerase-like protein n=1 Tax=Coleophoma crateriformis TaxID=565419 RepID=A0A3D8SZN7_9HELO|nr:xylose isomerase-like protein [Coleophoma crateriformis]